MTEIPSEMQKLMFKGMLKDEKTLAESKMKAGTKVMLIGNKPEAIAAANTKPEDWEEVIDDFGWDYIPTPVRSVHSCCTAGTCHSADRQQLNYMPRVLHRRRSS